MRRTAGILYVVTAFVSGYWEFNLMMRPLIGGPSSWWYPVTLGASVLLLAGGILTLVSQMKSGRLVAFVASLVLSAWWIPASVHTLRVYFSPRPLSPNPSELFWALSPILLIVASLIVGVAVWKSPGAIKGRLGQRPENVGRTQ
jgi:hypothetical protein